MPPELVQLRTPTLDKREIKWFGSCTPRCFQRIWMELDDLQRKTSADDLLGVITLARHNHLWTKLAR